jgi:hypothetical protein
MGKINEYQRQQLASSAVGVAEPSRAGEIIGGAVAQIGGVIQKKELEMRETSTTLQANDGVMQFGLEFQKLSKGLQMEMASNPSGYQEKLLTEGQKLLEQFAGGFSNTQARSKFLGSASSFLKNQAMQANDWVFAKEKENAVIAANSSLRTALIAVGKTNSREELLANINTTEKELLSLIPNNVMSKVDQQEFLKKNMPNAIESHLFNMVMRDAEGAKKMLEDGEYDKVPYMTQDIKEKFIKQADTRINRDRVELGRMRDDTYQKALELAIDDQLTFADIDALSMSANPAEQLTHQRINTLKMNLIRRVEAKAGALEKTNEQAAEYIELVRMTFDSRVDRAKALDRIASVWDDNVVDKDERRFLLNVRSALFDARTDRMNDGMFKAITTIRNGVYRAFRANPGQATHAEAQAIRGLINRVKDGAEPEPVASALMKDMEKSMLSERGILPDSIPKQGVVIRDNSSGIRWRIMPDGTKVRLKQNER